MRLLANKICEGCDTSFKPKLSKQRFCTVLCYRSNMSGDKNPNWKNGIQSHSMYFVYHDMIARCTKPNHMRYADYGGRGISVCQEWCENFWSYVEYLSEKPGPEMSVDRINNDGNYEPGNVRWATRSQQAKNVRPNSNPNNRNQINGQFIPRSFS